MTVKVKFLKDRIDIKSGEIAFTGEKSAANLVSQGYATYVEQPQSETVKELIKSKEYEILKECENKQKEILKTIEKEVETFNKEEEKDNFGRAMKVYLDKIQLANVCLKIQPIYYDEAKIWWIWDFNKKYWKICDEIEIQNKVYLTTGANTINSKELNETMQALKQAARMFAPEEIPKTWIQFKDCIIDIKTNERIEPNPKWFTTNPIPWGLGESEDTPIIDKIFMEWVGKVYIKLLYEILAYCLLSDYPIHRLFCFMGSGRNGKSKFQELIIKFIGFENCTSADLDKLIQSNFEKSRLYKKLVCIVGETNFNELSKTSTIKQLTGQDLVPFEFKYKTGFSNFNFAKILIATNNLPTTTDKTEGFYRRWCILDFPNKFSEKKNILEEIPIQEFNNLAKKSVKILKELLEKKEFDNEGSLEERQKKYEDKSNPLDKFFKENIKEDFENYISKRQFKEKLDEWCKSNNFRKIGDKEISVFMNEKNIKTRWIWFKKDGQDIRYRSWDGIKWEWDIF